VHIKTNRVTLLRREIANGQAPAALGMPTKRRAHDEQINWIEDSRPQKRELEKCPSGRDNARQDIDNLPRLSHSVHGKQDHPPGPPSTCRKDRMKSLKPSMGDNLI